MSNYIEETLSFIESVEMREHLLKCIEESPWGWRCICAEIVALAPAPIEKKIPVFDLSKACC